jgi:aminoacylase
MNSNEMIGFLQDYIRIKTAMPDPDYEAVGQLFEAHAVRDGFIFNRYLLPSGYPCFIITAQGKNPALPALVLNHHMDVVPVFEQSLWNVDPFAGAIVDDTFIGRGVQDTKGLGAVHYFALKKYMQDHILQRTVHIIIVPDEECGGFKGTVQLIEQPFFKALNIGCVLDEGPSSGDPQSMIVKVNERRPLQIRITTTGTAGHGSHLHIDNALHRLCKITHALVTHQDTQRATQGDPGTVTSCNITHITSGNTGAAYNVVPHEAYALVDIRIAPHETQKDITTWLDGLCAAHNATYIVLASVPDRAQVVAGVERVYDTIAEVVRNHHFKCQSIVSEGASDLRFYWERSIPGVGFAPFTSPYNAHGINESRAIAELFKARDIMQDCIHAFNSTEGLR